MNRVALVILFLLISCQENSDKRQNVAFLGLGNIIQNGDQIEIHTKVVPGIWSKAITISSVRSHCILVKRKKENLSDMKLVEMSGKDCQLGSDAKLEEWKNLKGLSFAKEKETFNLRYIKDQKEKTYSWRLLQRVESKKMYSVSLNCGGSHQPACYRGSKYKKNVINVCTTHNEQYFCATGLKLYCKEDRFECL